jgi:hypothetical protein
VKHTHFPLRLHASKILKHEPRVQPRDRPAFERQVVIVAFISSGATAPWGHGETKMSKV